MSEMDCIWMNDALMEDMEMEDKQMDREEILRYAAEQDAPDEREEHYDLTSTDDAYLIGQILCSVIALIKIFVFRKKPYDIFAIQFGAETAYLYKKWKALRRKKHFLAMVVYGILFILTLGCLFAGEDDLVKKNDV